MAIINPLIHGIYRVFQSMAGGLWCHPHKDDICMMRDDSGGRFATLPHLKGCSKHRFPARKPNVVLHLILLIESF